MYAIVNVENLKLYEPPLIDDQGGHVQIPSIDDFSPEYLTELQEDTILDQENVNFEARKCGVFESWS
jgi:hypothetical protein